jgi:hypothetical protein
MTYRRRVFIPIIHDGNQIAHLVWKDGAMEAWVAEDFIGRYPTRKEAAAALYKVLRQMGVRRWTTHPNGEKEENQ